MWGITDMPPMPYTTWGKSGSICHSCPKWWGKSGTFYSFIFLTVLSWNINDCELRHCIMQSDVCLCVRPNFKGLASIHHKAGHYFVKKRCHSCPSLPPSSSHKTWYRTDIFSHFGLIDIFPKFKMAAAAILDFQIMWIWLFGCADSVVFVFCTKLG